VNEIGIQPTIRLCFDGAVVNRGRFRATSKCRRPHNRLGFAYQVAFVWLFDRFPQQQLFELFEELVCFSAAQLGLDAGLIELYRKRRPTISFYSSFC
jgi:Domain of unknown function (DUF4158)